MLELLEEGKNVLSARVDLVSLVFEAELPRRKIISNGLYGIYIDAKFSLVILHFYPSSESKPRLCKVHASTNKPRLWKLFHLK